MCNIVKTLSNTEINRVFIIYLYKFSTKYYIFYKIFFRVLLSLFIFKRPNVQLVLTNNTWKKSRLSRNPYTQLRGGCRDRDGNMSCLRETFSPPAHVVVVGGGKDLLCRAPDTESGTSINISQRTYSKV